jgi:3-methyladenine DNA glycosylase/8-oxoguanine DNA glycosylase
VSGSGGGRLHPDPAAVTHLRAADPRLARVIERVGGYDRPLEADLWRALAGSIISQQLSLKAAATIEGRVACLGAGERFPSPAEILAASQNHLRGCGLSRAKTGYIRGVAEAFQTGAVDPDGLREMDDEAIIERLVRLKGVGRWTAEMVLIFSLGRPDVLPVDDLGFRVAVQRAWGMEERPAAGELREIATGWAPHRTTATLYLWESLDA